MLSIIIITLSVILFIFIFTLTLAMLTVSKRQDIEYGQVKYPIAKARGLSREAWGQLVDKRAKTFLIERRGDFSSPCLKAGVSEIAVSDDNN